MIPISLYIHIPWCDKKCPYCSFLSYKYFNNNNLIKKYILNLIFDLKKNFSFKNDNRYIHSIYIGGGTPSLLSIKNIQFLLNKIFLYFPIKKNMEITIESNISFNEIKKIIFYPKIGINRISVGIQSFDNNVLGIIGRKYNIYDINKFIKNIFIAGYKNFNIDLIYGLPGQNICSVLNDLKYVVDNNIFHLSWYQLDIKKYSYYYSFLPLNLPSKKEVEDMYFLGKEFLIKNGYFQYELSSYVKNKYNYCSHNVNYWEFGDYIGLGCGSYSKITLLNNFSVYRIKKNLSLKKYINGLYIYYKKKINTNDIIIDYFICRLRLLIPFSYSEFSFYTGINYKKIKKNILLAIDKNFLIYFKKKKDEFILTDYGILFLDECLEIFIN